jgi:hypothetical protein
MSQLVSLTEFQQFLGVPDGKDQELLDLLLKGSIKLFERLCDRVSSPFSAEVQSGIVEVHSGTGSDLLALNYPIATVTTIKLGHNVSAPVEMLTPADTNQVVWAADSRFIYRVDGKWWGDYGRRRYVHVTYDAAIDAPEDAKVAVMRPAAQIYRMRGSEDASSFSASGYSQTMAQMAAEDPLFVAAIQSHRRVAFA